MTKNKDFIYAFALASLAIAVMSYFAFGIVNFLACPWWFILSSDGDGTYITQTLSLLNNGPLELVFHPGATVYGVIGIVLRVASWCHPGFNFLSLGQAHSLSNIFVVLDNGMHISRCVIFSLNICCLFLFWRVLYQLCNNRIVSLGLSAFFMTTYFMMDERIVTLRPELCSFVFALMLFSMLLSAHKKSPQLKIKGIIFMVCLGFVAGLALLAKIQIIIWVGCLLLWWVFFVPLHLKVQNQKAKWLVLMIAIINLAIMPWAWAKRPDFLLGYLKNLNPIREEHHLYGTAPDTVAPFYFTVLLGLMVLSVLPLLWRHRYFQVLMQWLMKINLFITGLIVSLYGVFLFLGQSINAYNAAGNHLLYATTTNIVYGGVVNHRVIDWLTWKAIINMQSGNTFLGIGILWYVAFGAGLCAWRLFRRCKPTLKYALILSLFILGIAVDILSTFRQYFPGQVIIISSYAIYSLPIHVCALALLFATETSLLMQKLGQGNLKKVINAVFFIHIIMVAVHVGRMAKWDVHNAQRTPNQEMQNTLSVVPGFWHMASGGQI